MQIELERLNVRPIKILHIKGKVVSGRGEGTKYIKLPWVARQITEKLGFIPYPGTLNIKLKHSHISFKKLLKEANYLEILPKNGYCRGKCFNAYLMDVIKCAVVVPEVASYPEETIEIIAPINLREKLKLKDGDSVEVKIIL